MEIVTPQAGATTEMRIATGMVCGTMEAAEVDRRSLLLLVKLNRTHQLLKVKTRSRAVVLLQ